MPTARTSGGLSDEGVSAHSRWLTVLAMLLVLVVSFSNFSLSSTVLHDLAALSGIPGDVARLWLVIVDGTIAAATLALYSPCGNGRRSALPMVTCVRGILSRSLRYRQLR